MLAVYGTMTDPPIMSLVEALQEANRPYVLVELGALEFERLSIDVGPRGVEGLLVVAGQVIPLADIRSVYARLLELPPCWSSPGASARARHLHELLVQWLDIAPALVVNRPRAMQSNGSKPFQSQLIGESGFRVPETLVTSNERDVRAFWREHRRVVFKSTSGIRSIVQELDESSAARLERLRCLPTQFQEFVEGVDVRVHVVGRQTFASEVHGNAIDYRYASRNGIEVSLSATDLPPSIVSRCIDLSERLELPLAGIDLRRRPDGEFVCFEVNPMPAYSYYELNTGQPISRALAHMLVEGDREL